MGEFSLERCVLAGGAGGAVGDHDGRGLGAAETGPALLDRPVAAVQHGPRPIPLPHRPGASGAGRGAQEEARRGGHIPRAPQPRPAAGEGARVCPGRGAPALLHRVPVAF